MYAIKQASNKTKTEDKLADKTNGNLNSNSDSNSKRKGDKSLHTWTVEIGRSVEFFRVRLKHSTSEGLVLDWIWGRTEY